MFFFFFCKLAILLCRQYSVICNSSYYITTRDYKRTKQKIELSNCQLVRRRTKLWIIGKRVREQKQGMEAPLYAIQFIKCYFNKLL